MAPATTYGAVERTAWLSPNMVRITLGGDGLAGFSPTEFTDQHVNALFIPPGGRYTVPFDLEAARSLESEMRPMGRRITVRSWDPERQELALDFLTHGEEGFAGRWAREATAGDLLQMLGPVGSYRPNPDADWFLMAGDESALPAIAASLEAVPAGRPCLALVLVDGPEHEIELTSAAALEVRWLHRRTAMVAADLLLDAMAELDWLGGRVDAFVHGEAGEIRAARRHLLAERGVAKSDVSISPYWRRDHTEEAWRATKRQWLEDQELDT